MKIGTMNLLRKTSSGDPVVELFSGTLWEAEMIKSLLESAGIRSFLKNSVLNSYAYEPARAEGVSVMVLRSDYPEAKKVADDFEQNQRIQP